MTPPDPATYHWFIGDGMVHGLRLGDGRAEWYRNRWVRGDDVVNTHVIGVAGRTFALVEAGRRPVELTDELDTIGSCRFDDTLDGSFSAHTHRDPATGLLHAVTYHWSWDHIRHVVLGPDAHVRREVQIPVPDGPSVHDCAITERFVVLFDLPVTFSMDAVSGGALFPYRWNPDHPPRVGLLPLDGDPDDVRWFEAPVVLRVPHAQRLRRREPRRRARPGGRRPRAPPAHVRHRAERARRGRPGARAVDARPAWPARCRPRRSTTGRRSSRASTSAAPAGRHRYGYGAGFGAGVEHGPALKHDLAAGTTAVHDYGPGRVTLEPLFVPRSPDAAADPGAVEDDGWVMSYVYDATTDRSDVVILDAQDFTGDPVATVHLPVRVPFGFHGSWVPDA